MPMRRPPYRALCRTLSSLTCPDLGRPTRWRRLSKVTFTLLSSNSAFSFARAPFEERTHGSWLAFLRSSK